VSAVIGHQAVVEGLKAHLASVVLLIGPEHVGKKTIASQAMRWHAPLSVDQYWASKLTADAAREAVQFSAFASHGPCKVAVLCLDGARGEALNTLLKLLEEPPASVRCILVASSTPMPTIWSRVMQFWPCGLLSDAEVQAVLEQQGLDSAQAAQRALLARGRVRPAMDVVPRSRAVVLGALRAALSRDTQQLSSALRLWDSDCQEMLVMWCQEALSGRWHVFSASDNPAGARFARSLLTALLAVSTARPRTAARAALDVAMKEIS
jgi:DNA polymerase III delta subunit-like protein